MAFEMNRYFDDEGTKFRLHPQSPVLEDFREPETVYVSSQLGSLGPGPSDDRMYVVNPVEKKPYGPEYLPPFDGAMHPAAKPSPEGHFDHLETGTPEFISAHLFGSIRRVLDIWEVYAGGPIPWHFQLQSPQLELVPHIPWKNAQFGWGFCEFGEDVDDEGIKQPFALNFDIIAHEVGHGLVFSMTGLPRPDELTTEFLGFHESASDLVAIISALHFNTFIDHILKKTTGDLYTENELNRIGELSTTRQIRTASNTLKMESIHYRDKKPSDLTGHEVHEMGQPLTGAFFDIAVDFFVDELVKRDVISPQLAEEIRRAAVTDELLSVDRREFLKTFVTRIDDFRDALKNARDMSGLRLARCWHRLRPADLKFTDVAEAFIQADHSLTKGKHRKQIEGAFEWRGII